LGVVLSRGTGTSTSATATGPKKFSQCLDNGEQAAKVTSDQQLGESLGVQGTPALFVNGYLIAGAFPYEAVKLVVNAVLAGKTPAWDTKTYGELTKVTMPELVNAVWKGDENSKVTVVEFSDFQCPYCQRFTPTVAQMLTEYGSKIRFAFYNFPLTSIHPQAQKAAEAFECAMAQDEDLGWKMHDKLFSLGEQNSLNVDNFKKAASELGLK
jgi:protein-disulfide isomerase